MRQDVPVQPGSAQKLTAKTVAFRLHAQHNLQAHHAQTRPQGFGVHGCNQARPCRSAGLIITVVKAQMIPKHATGGAQKSIRNTKHEHTVANTCSWRLDLDVERTGVFLTSTEALELLSASTNLGACKILVHLDLCQAYIE